MILTTILIMIIGMLLFGGIFLLGVGGGLVTILASDLIVAAGIIFLVVRWIRNRKK